MFVLTQATGTMGVDMCPEGHPYPEIAVRVLGAWATYDEACSALGAFLADGLSESPTAQVQRPEMNCAHYALGPDCANVTVGLLRVFEVAGVYPMTVGLN